MELKITYRRRWRDVILMRVYLALYRITKKGKFFTLAAMRSPFTDGIYLNDDTPTGVIGARGHRIKQVLLTDG